MYSKPVVNLWIALTKPKGAMKLKSVVILLLILVTGVVLVGCAGGPRPTSQEDSRISREEFYVKYSKWPVWRDVPIETSNYERIWRTTVDILSENFALEVMDKASGYVRTGWIYLFGVKPALQRRYTVKIYPEEGRIRIGIEVKPVGREEYIHPKMAWKIGAEKLWGEIPQEIRNRLREVE